MVRVRKATEADWPSIWPIVEGVVRAGGTTPSPGVRPGAAGRGLGRPRPPGGTRTAGDEAGRVLGTAKLGPNQLGPGSHVANASFMVADGARGRGVGRALGEAAISRATADGYRAMQFNAVVEVNHSAVALWKALGFAILGTSPEAFDHPRDGLVGLHIMHRRL